MAEQAELAIEDRMANYLKPAAPAPAAVEAVKSPVPHPAGDDPKPAAPEQPAAEPPADPEEGEVTEETPQDAPVEDDDTVELDPDAPLMEITTKKDDGSEETRKWSLAEMKKGVMLEADYRRKTAELARERESIPQKTQEQAQQIAQAYAQRLGVIETAVTQMAQREIGNVDWNKLSKEDPAEFVRLSARANELNQIFNAAHTELQALGQQQQLAAQQEQQKRIRESVEVLNRDIPNWSNEHYANLLKFGQNVYGFTHEEVASVTDARMIKALNDAFAYQALKAAKPAVEKRLASVPKVLKPGATEGRTDRRDEADSQARRQLRKSGGKDMDAAAALFLNRMNRNRGTTT